MTLEEWFALVSSALIDATCAWQTPRQIAAALGRTEEETKDALADLDVAGLVSVWAEHKPMVVTLTSLAAARLCVRLTETPRTLICKWTHDAVSVLSRKRPTYRQLERMERHERALREIPGKDTAGETDELIDLAESFARSRRRSPVRRDELPPPTIVLTGSPLIPWDESPRRLTHSLLCTRCRQWPGKGRRRMRLFVFCDCGRGRRRIRLAICPVCWDRPLSLSTLCLRCGRWGWDAARRNRKGKGP